MQAENKRKSAQIKQLETKIKQQETTIKQAEADKEQEQKEREQIDSQNTQLQAKIKELDALVLQGAEETAQLTQAKTAAEQEARQAGLALESLRSESQEKDAMNSAQTKVWK